MSCSITPNPDISGVGVRAATYAQNLLSFAPAIYALLDRNVTPTELDSLETQSTTILITGFAILISAIIQALTHALSDFHATIILSLSWMNNTNTFIYFLLHIYREIGVLQKKEHGEPDSDEWDSDGGRFRWVKMTKKALRNRVLIIGSLHLSLMAAVGIWFWSRPASFGNTQSCPSSPSVAILGGKVSLSSVGLRRWSIFIYSLLLLPGLNLVVPIGVFIIPYVLYVHSTTRISKPNTRAALIPATMGLVSLAVVNVIFLIDIEAALINNSALLSHEEKKWTFGQTLAVLLLLIPGRDLLEMIMERRPKWLAKKLLTASEEGKTDIVKDVIEQGANINMKDPDGRTALLRAVCKGHSDIARYLVEHHADVNVCDRNGETALIGAAWHGHLDMVKDLVDHGARVNAEARNGWTALMGASSRGELDMFKYLVDHGADLDAKNLAGWTPLTRTVEDQHQDMVRYLVESDADINEKRSDGQTALMIAVQNGQLNMVEYLIGHGADVNAKDHNGETALMGAAWCREFDMVKYLIECRADVNTQDQKGQTALMQAASRRELDMVKCLIDHGADVNTCDLDGETALTGAVWHGELDIVRYLIEHGANINAKDRRGQTALMVATEHSELDAMKCLIEHGADVNAKDLDGRTALMMATQRGQLDKIKCLIDLGADVNAKGADTVGITVLGDARRNGHSDVAKYLLQHGAGT